ncbi:MAG: hypothetical protein WD673_00735 [Alphaproteobacteria bacterium]
MPTDEMTLQIADIAAGAASGDPGQFVVFGDELVFTADGPEGREPWRFDGTSASLVADINPGSFGSGPVGFTEFKGNLYFGAKQQDHIPGSPSELWKYDGIGVDLIEQFSNGPLPQGFTVLGDTLVFSAFEESTGFELWGFDGASVFQIADIAAGAASGDPGQFVVFGDELVFTADGPEGREPWRFDGTSASLVADINPGSFGSGPVGFTEFKGNLYFGAKQQDHIPGSPSELWKYDGIGVDLIEQFSNGPLPQGFTVLGDTLVFSAFEESTGFELWGLRASNRVPAPSCLYLWLMAFAFLVCLRNKLNTVADKVITATT